MLSIKKQKLSNLSFVYVKPAFMAGFFVPVEINPLIFY